MRPTEQLIIRMRQHYDAAPQKKTRLRQEFKPMPLTTHLILQRSHLGRKAFWITIWLCHLVVLMHTCAVVMSSLYAEAFARLLLHIYTKKIYLR